MTVLTKLLILCIVIVSIDNVQGRRTGSTGDYQELVVECPAGLKWCGRFYGCLKVCPRKRREARKDYGIGIGVSTPNPFDCPVPLHYCPGAGCKPCCVDNHCNQFQVCKYVNQT